MLVLLTVSVTAVVAVDLPKRTGYAPAVVIAAAWVTLVSVFGLATHAAVPVELQPKNCPLDPPDGI